MRVTGIDDNIATAVKDCGLVLHGIVHQQTSTTIYIKRLDDGVSIKDCEAVIKQLGYMTDIDDLHIEVESSGYAPLMSPEHYEAHIGKKIKIKTKAKIFKAQLMSINANGITILDQNEEIALKWEEISRSTPLYLE
ncbi:hypothetical protein OAT84_01490 [Gammaproteobacteria bacterium]|nr:hypothetical protein [Gammaproteobacteria bacterium]